MRRRHVVDPVRAIWTSSEEKSRRAADGRKS
jgi:hypothetical protein